MAKTNEKIEALKSKVAELNKQVREESQRLLNEGFEDVFEKYPKLISFSWNQYTPYFNDGDECTFRVNPDSLIPRFTDENEDGEEFDYEYETRDSEFVSVKGKWITQPLEVTKEKAENNAAFRELYDLVNAIDNDTMKATYGNHITVTISKEEDGTLKTDSEEYQHD